MDYDLDHLLQDFEKEKLVVATIAERASNLVKLRDKQIADLKHENLDLRRKIEALNQQMDFILADGHTATKRMLRVGNQQITVDWSETERPSLANWVAEDTPVGETKEVFGMRERRWLKGKVKGKPDFTFSSASSTTGGANGIEAAPGAVPAGEPTKAAAEVVQGTEEPSAAVTHQPRYQRPPSRRRTYVPSHIASRQNHTDTSAGPLSAAVDNGASASPHTTNSFNSTSDLVTMQQTAQSSTNPAAASSSKKRSLSEADSGTVAPSQLVQELYFGSDHSGVGAGDSAGNGTGGHSTSTTGPSASAPSAMATSAQVAAPGGVPGPAATVGASSSAALVGGAKPDSIDELARQMILGLDGGSPLVENSAAHRSQQSQQQPHHASLTATHPTQSHRGAAPIPQQYPMQQPGNTVWGSALPMSWPSAPAQMPNPQTYFHPYANQPLQPALQGGLAGERITGAQPAQVGHPPGNYVRPVPQQGSQQSQHPHFPPRQAVNAGLVARPLAVAKQAGLPAAPIPAKPLDYSVLISANSNNTSTNLPASQGTAAGSPRARPAATVPPPAKKAKTAALARLMQEHQMHKAMQKAASSGAGAVSGVARPPVGVLRGAPGAQANATGATALPSTSASAKADGVPRSTVPVALPAAKPPTSHLNKPPPTATQPKPLLPSAAGQSSVPGNQTIAVSGGAAGNGDGASGSSSSSGAGSGSASGGMAASGSVVPAVNATNANKNPTTATKTSTQPADNQLDISPGPPDTPQAWHQAGADLAMRRKIICTMVEKSKDYQTNKGDRTWLTDRKNYCMVLERVLYSQAVSKQQYTHAISEAIKEGLV